MQKLNSGALNRILLFVYILSLSTNAIAQNKKNLKETYNLPPQGNYVYGRVIEKLSNEPMVGVTIRLDGHSNGVITDINGCYVLTLPEEGGLVIYSYIGFETRKIKTTSRQKVDVLMVEATESIQEVIVTGYNSIQKESFTGNTTKIEKEDLLRVNPNNLISAIQTFDPSFRIQENLAAGSDPNSLPQFVLRGQTGIGQTTLGQTSTSSISREVLSGNSNLPIFILDGFEVDVEKIYDLDMNSIHSINILKDAAATSLYGSAGAYGVILIETKKGDSPKPRVTYSGNFTISTPPSLREVAIGNTERNLLKWQILNNDTSQLYHGYQDIMFMPAVSDSLNPYFNNNTDWQDQFYRVTYNQSHNISFSGGDNLFNYKVNGNYYTEKGIVKNTDFNRYALTGNMNYTSPNSKFTIGVDMKVGFTDNSTGSGNAVSQSGVASGASASSLLPPPSLYSASVAALQVFGVENSTVKSNYSATVNLGYALPFDIKWRGTFNYSYNSTDQEKFTPAILSDSKYSAIAYNYNSNESKVYIDTHVSRTFDLKYVMLGLTTGIRYNSRTSTGNSITYTGLPNDYIIGPVGHGKSEGSATVSQNQSTFSFMFAPNFKIKTKDSFKAGGDKYIFDPTISPELSSVYGTRTKWNINPSLGFRWNIGYESFMDRFTWLDNMSFRLTWGQVVKYKATRYDVFGTYDIDPGNTYNGESYIPIDYKRLPNINLDPVTTTTWNFGYDMSIFNNRLSANIDAYYRQVDNQLSDIELPNHAGFEKVRSTEVSLVNYGLEVSLRGKPLSVQSKWNLLIGLNFALNRDVITKLPNEARQILNSDAWVANRLGGNTTSMLLYINKGVYATDEDVPVDPATGKRLRLGGKNTDEAYFKAGDPIWVDVNGDYVIDDKDRVVAANARPKVTGGLFFNLSYKEFSMHVNTSFVFKRDIINSVLAKSFKAYDDPVRKSIESLRKDASLSPIEKYNFWTENNRYNAIYPNPYNYHHNKVIDPFREAQTLFLEEGSYFKLNTVSLSYRFPKRWLDFFRVRGVTLKASVNNIWTFSNYSGISPESVNGLGRDTSGGYPNSRTWTMGVVLSL